MGQQHSDSLCGKSLQQISKLRIALGSDSHGEAYFAPAEHHTVQAVGNIGKGVILMIYVQTVS